MVEGDFDKLMDDTYRALCGGARSVAVLGFTPTAIKVVSALRIAGFGDAVRGIYAASPSGSSVGTQLLPLDALRLEQLDVLVIASDADKEDILNAAIAHVQGNPQILIAGYGHLQYRDPIYADEIANLLVPSLANGYPNVLVHLYQCLQNSSRLGLEGVVAEFGMFKGGTTAFLARVARRLGLTCRVIGFDTFTGFPPRRSPFDMYDHPDCEFKDLDAVERYVSGFGVEIVPGDIVQTCNRLKGERIILSFFDTDNYTACKAALSIVADRTLVGGAIVFDHFAGVDRFRYTLGERMAAKVLADDDRFFNLHGSGVFFRQR